MSTAQTSALTSPGAQVLKRSNDLATRINAALPQTQCRRCQYPDCGAYAQAIADGTADINQCPPGGAEGITRLAQITGRAAPPLNPAHGREAPRTVAVIDEAWCIGCTLCIKACPTDAIVGSNKWMHTVVEQYCTGCELCVPVCPVDCITLETVSGSLTGWSAWSAQQAHQARGRYELRLARLATQGMGHAGSAHEVVAQAPDALQDQATQAPHTDTSHSLDAAATKADDASAAARRAAVAAAMERARRLRAADER